MHGILEDKWHAHTKRVPAQHRQPNLPLDTGDLVMVEGKHEKLF